MALTCKSYLALNVESDEMKRSSKGIPHRVKLQMDQYRDVLLQNNEERHKVPMKCLRLTNDKKMARYSFEKRGLSDLFFKLRVADDGITCSPLTEDGEYL